jgi:hypothetical protein
MLLANLVDSTRIQRLVASPYAVLLIPFLLNSSI